MALSLFLQTCGNPCLNLYALHLTTPSRSASHTCNRYAIWTGTGTLTSLPTESISTSATRKLSTGDEARVPKDLALLPPWVPAAPGPCCPGCCAVAD